MTKTQKINRYTLRLRRRFGDLPPPSRLTKGLRESAIRRARVEEDAGAKRDILQTWGISDAEMARVS